MDKSTILLNKETITMLKEVKLHPRESYDDLLKRMAKFYKIIHQRNQYDEFLHKVQQPKMQELWDNKDDEIWEHVR